MESKKTVLVKVTYLIELPEEELDDVDGVLDKVLSKIDPEEAKYLMIDGNEYEAKWNSTSSFVLDPDDSNCGKCSNCGQWTTDREKPEAVEELCNGATVDGKLLCDECLPHDHRWAFLI